MQQLCSPEKSHTPKSPYIPARESEFPPKALHSRTKRSLHYHSPEYKKYSSEKKKSPILPHRQIAFDRSFVVDLTSLMKSNDVLMRHVIYEWVMSYMGESCPVWMSHVTSVGPHVTYEKWLRVNASCHVWLSHVPYEWVISHMNSHVTCECILPRMNASCHVWISHVTYGVATISRIDKIIGLFCRI